MKRLFAVVLSSLLLVTGCSSSNNQTTTTNEEVTATPSTNGDGSVESKDELKEAFNEKLGDTKPLWYNSVRNDSNGNWRCLVIYSDVPFETVAADYYNAYFSSNDEIHIIENLYLKTCTVISYVMDDTLSVTVHEYVDKEEHDAKLMASGMVLREYFVTISTGEIEDISEE